MVAVVCCTPPVISPIARYLLRIAIFAYLTCIQRPPLGGSLSEYCYDVLYGKTRIISLPGGEKNFEDIFICFDRVQKRDGRTEIQTNGHTDIARRHRLHLRIVSRGKKLSIKPSKGTKFSPTFERRKSKRLSASGGLCPPNLLTRDSAPETPCTGGSQTPVIGSHSALAIRPPLCLIPGSDPVSLQQ